MQKPLSQLTTDVRRPEVVDQEEGFTIVSGNMWLPRRSRKDGAGGIGRAMGAGCPRTWGSEVGRLGTASEPEKRFLSSLRELTYSPGLCFFPCKQKTVEVPTTLQ